MLSALLVALLLLVPGAALRRAFGLARGPWGCGVFAIDAALSLGLLSLVLLPLYLLRAPVTVAPVAAGIATAAAMALAWRRGQATAQAQSSRSEWAIFVAALALLVPATLAHSGANVDDWWDLSFVSGWLAGGRFGFAQMALSPDPGTAASALHPRFLWSVWLMLQATVASLSGEAPWHMQAVALAGMTSLLVVSAQAALARALFRRSPRAQLLVNATIAMTVAWLWGTEAIPMFVRGYQDKLFAAFALAPAVVALVVDALSERDEARGKAAAASAVALAALATVSVHSLVFTMAVVVAGAAGMASKGRGILAWALAHRGVVAALALPCLYPLGQALVLAGRFGDQGISLATRDNPVVRAHLALGRLVATSTPAWIVHPGAVFGSVALLLPLALVVAWRRRGDDGARMLLAMTLLPASLLFVPGLAALAGRLWVPWMLYRLGWMVPVAPLLAYLLVETAGRRTPARIALAATIATVVMVLGATTAADRLRRDLRDHPGPAPSAPDAAAAVAYDFLGAQPGRDAVLAPPNFAELAPALSGKPVVAFSERGTLVFSMDETLAYERLRDRARFFFTDTLPAERDAIAARYAARWAVLPRRLVASGREEDWLWRYGPEALLASRRYDDGVQAAGSIAGAAGACDAQAASSSGCRGWWTRDEADIAAAFGSSWKVALATRDYFVIERTGNAPADAHSTEVVPKGTGVVVTHEAAVSTDGNASKDDTRPRWLRPFSTRAPDPARSHRTVLASAAGAPGAVVATDVPPRFVLPSVLPVWLEGPGAWEDAPAEVAITLDAGTPCTFEAIEVVPHLPRERREVLEVSVDGRSATLEAVHGRSIFVALSTETPRSAVTVKVRSLLGNPVSLADLRLVGDAGTCGGDWPVHRDATFPAMRPDTGDLLHLASSHPGGARTFIAMARRAARERGQQAAVELLQEAVRRDPSLAEAWIELGFAHEELAAAGGVAADEAARQRGQARDAFGGAVRADSNSAWARGSKAWADRNAGHTFAALAQAFVAAGLDPLYGDAWTIAAYALGDLRLYSLAERALRVAEATDPARNWPATARADLAMKSRDPAAIDGARTSLQAWIRAHPLDQAARAKLSQLAAASPP